jgi:hypothetical protein
MWVTYGPLASESRCSARNLVSHNRNKSLMAAEPRLPPPGAHRPQRSFAGYRVQIDAEDLPSEGRSPGSPDDHPGVPGRIVQLGTMSTHPNTGGYLGSLALECLIGEPRSVSVAPLRRDGPVHAPWRSPSGGRGSQHLDVRPVRSSARRWRPSSRGGRGSQLPRHHWPAHLRCARETWPARRPRPGPGRP